MGAIELFTAWDHHVTATEDEWKQAVGRLLDCSNALTAHYYPFGGDDQLTVIGSAAKSTSVRPMSDSDGVFRMPAGTYTRFNDYAGNGQSALLQEVRGVLAKRYPRTTIRGDGPVVVVGFSSGPNVEIVPGVLVSDGADIFHASCVVPVTRDGGSWESADYGAEYDNASRAQASTHGQSSRLVRYMKAWRRAQNATMRSIVLELMVLDFMRMWPKDRTGHVYDDWLVRDFLGYTVDHYYSTYALPSGKRIDTGVGWYEDAMQSRRDAVAACEYGDASPLYVSCWRKVFGSGFGS
jgi:hypothetical protein